MNLASSSADEHRDRVAAEVGARHRDDVRVRVRHHRPQQLAEPAVLDAAETWWNSSIASTMSSNALVVELVVANRSVACVQTSTVSGPSRKR